MCLVVFLLKGDMLCMGFVEFLLWGLSYIVYVLLSSVCKMFRSLLNNGLLVEVVVVVDVVWEFCLKLFNDVEGF